MKPIAKRLLIVVILLLALLLATEIGLTLAAQKGLSVYLRDRFALDREPSVSISSFPITVNALRGRVNSTRIRIDGSAPIVNLADLVEPLPYRLTVDVSDARFSLSDLLSGHLKLKSVGRVEANLQLTQESLSSFLSGTGLSVRLEGNLIFVIPDVAPESSVECKVYVYDASTIALQPKDGSAGLPSGIVSSEGSLLVKLPVQTIPMHPSLLSVVVAKGALTVKARLDESQLVQSGT